MYILDRRFRPLLDALFQYKKALKRYSRGIPSVVAAHIHLERCYDGVCAHLEDKNIIVMIDDEVKKAKEMFDGLDIVQKISELPADQLNVEFALASNVGFTKQSVKKDFFELVKKRLNFTTQTTDDFLAFFRDAHKEAIEKIKASRQCAKKEKKIIKKRHIKASTHSIISLVCVSTNLCLGTFPPSYIASVVFAGNAIDHAIGDDPE